MKKFALLAAVLALTACGDMPDITGSNNQKTFKNMGLAAYPQAAGTAKYADLSNGDRATTLNVTGLKAGTDYVAHYHAKGSESSDVCRSNGPVVGGLIGGRFTTDASGSVTLRGLQAQAALKEAAYINVHEADNLPTVPVCAPL